MRTPFAVAFMLTIILVGTYWYSSVSAICNLPISYRIGELDERFDLSLLEARSAVSDAESIWEDATGRNLFTYDENASFAVNFIFDERQAFADTEEAFRETLNAKENINDAISDTYAQLVADYNKLSLQYEDTKAGYERKLYTYNTKVASYNESGGAPPDEYEALQKEKDTLDVQLATVNAFASQLNKMTKEINDIGEKGNVLVAKYNEKVGTYNTTFGQTREFTQGDYQGDKINIYTFTDSTELRLVLAHELGHALALDHVANEQSVMYFLMGGQPDTLSLTSEDVEEFQLICGQVETYAQWRERLSRWLEVRGIFI